MNDLISIIIPVYNRQNVVGECIASIMAQSYQNFEIILIDDGSTDQTLTICRDLANSDPRITLLEAAHSGVSAARNKGLAIAKGEYVLFVDSDDVTHPLLLEELLQGMQTTDAAIGGTKVFDIPEKNWHKVPTMIADSADPGGVTYHSHQEALKLIFTTSSALSKIPGTIMRRDWIGQTQFREDLSIGEDFYFIYENLIKGANTVFLQKSRYFCRLHATNTSWDFGFTGFWSRFFRRELVWKNEEAMGRTEYANREKRSAFYSFLMCLRHNKPGSDDSKKMCQVLKDYKTILLPALSRKEKIHYYFSVYLPAFYLVFSGMKQRVKRLRRK